MESVHTDCIAFKLMIVLLYTESVRIGTVGNNADLYSGDAHFESRPLLSSNYMTLYSDTDTFDTKLHYLLTYLRSWALPEKLTIVQPFRKFPDILRNQKEPEYY
jgi:hypothetical protein